MKRSGKTLARVVLLAAGLGGAAAGAAQPPPSPIWPEPVRTRMAAPERLTITDRGEPGGPPDRAATGITNPDLTIFPADEPNGFALLIAPGGGYTRVVMDKEGYETARWFSQRGIASFVLRYRLPGETEIPHPEWPLADAQRAIRWIRHHAADYGIDPAKTGVLGFSAGGHLAAMLATAFDRRAYEPVDDLDGLSARPAFAVLMYPVISMRAGIAHTGSRDRLLGPSPSDALVGDWSPERRVTADTPAVFLLHAADDATVDVENALVMYRALRTAGIRAELHLYAEGGHGFGLRLAEGPVAGWPELARRWIVTGPHGLPE